MPKGREGKRVVSSGSFHKGMMPDIIGATDSLVDIVDGWIDRVGEIRKRGGKSLYETAIVGSISKPGRGEVLWSTYKGDADWAVAWAGDNGVIAKTAGGAAGNPFALGAGNNIVSATQYDRHIVFGSDGTVTGPYGGVSWIWAGAMTAPAGVDTVTVTAGSKDISGVTPGVTPGVFVRFTSGIGGFPLPEDDKIFYTVVAVNGSVATLDREPHVAPGAGPAIYSTYGRIYIATTGAPDQIVGNNAIHVCTHNDRLFLGNIVDDPTGGSKIRWSGTFNDQSPVNNRTGFHLWPSGAIIDVFPGVGGEITGLHSFGGSLVILKNRAAFILRGDVATGSYDLGASLDKITERSGAEIPGASTVSPIGVAWADRAGLFIWNGSNISVVSGGRIDSLWRDRFGDNPPTVLSATSDRIIMQNDVGATIIYDFDKDLFIEQNAGSFTNILEAPGGLELSVETLAVGSPVADTRIIGWHDDFSSSLENDTNHTDKPRLKFITQPLSPTMPFYTDRPNKLLVSGYIDDTGGDEPYMEASIIHGRNELEESGDAVQVLEYRFRKRGYDNTERIPIPGTNDRPAQRFKLEQINSAQDIRIYGIGVEYLGDYTTDPSNNTGASGYGS